MSAAPTNFSAPVPLKASGPVRQACSPFAGKRLSATRRRGDGDVNELFSPHSLRDKFVGRSSCSVSSRQCGCECNGSVMIAEMRNGLEPAGAGRVDTTRCCLSTEPAFAIVSTRSDQLRRRPPLAVLASEVLRRLSLVLATGWQSSQSSCIRARSAARTSFTVMPSRAQRRVVTVRMVRPLREPADSWVESTRTPQSLGRNRNARDVTSIEEEVTMSLSIAATLTGPLVTTSGSA